MLFALQLNDTVVYPVSTIDPITPSLFGILGETWLAGLACSQLAVFINYRRVASRLDTAFVAVTSVFGFTAWICSLRVLQWQLAENFGQPQALVRIRSVGYPLYDFFGFIANSAGQTFFARRAYKLSGGNKPLLALFIVGVPALFGLGEYIAVQALFSTLSGLDYVSNVYLIRRFVEAYCFGMAGLDFIICATICIGLIRARADGNLDLRTPINRLVTRIISLSLTTSIFTTLIVSSAALVLAFGRTGARWSVFTGYWAVMAYVLSTLFTINQKYQLREEVAGDVKRFGFDSPA